MLSGDELPREWEKNNTHYLFFVERSIDDPKKTIGQRFLDGSIIKDSNPADLMFMNGKRHLYYFPWKKESRDENIEEFICRVAIYLTEKELFVLANRLMQLELKKGDDAFLHPSLARSTLQYLILLYSHTDHDERLGHILNYLVKSHLLDEEARHSDEKAVIDHFIQCIWPVALEKKPEEMVLFIHDNTSAAIPNLPGALSAEMSVQRRQLLQRIQFETAYQNQSVTMGDVDEIIARYNEGRHSLFSHQSKNTAKLFKDLKACRFDADRSILIKSFMHDPDNSKSRAYKVIQQFYYQQRIIEAPNADPDLHKMVNEDWVLKKRQ